MIIPYMFSRQQTFLAFVIGFFLAVFMIFGISHFTYLKLIADHNILVDQYNILIEQLISCVKLEGQSCLN